MSIKYNAYIRYFDNLSGRGVVTVPSLNIDVFVHYSADSRLGENKSLSSRKGKLFVEYSSLDQVEVEIIFDSHYTQVSKIRPKNWITKKDLLSDKLVRFFSADSNCTNYWSDFCLNNILTLIDCEA